MTRRQAILASVISMGGTPHGESDFWSRWRPYLRVVLGGKDGISKLEVIHEGETITLTAAEIFAALKGED